MKKLKQVFTNYLIKLLDQQTEDLKTNWELIDEDNADPIHFKSIALHFKPTAGDNIQLRPYDQKSYFLVQGVEYTETGFTGKLYGKIIK